MHHLYAFLLIAAAVLICSGCGGHGFHANITPGPWTPPGSYDAATAAAVAGALALPGAPVGPQSCRALTVRATPGAVITAHGHQGTQTYVANAQGVPWIPGGMTSMDALVQPGSTLWLTVSGPPGIQVDWTGFQFQSVDGLGATWTAPEVCSSVDPAVQLVITVIAAVPAANG